MDFNVETNCSTSIGLASLNLKSFPNLPSNWAMSPIYFSILAVVPFCFNSSLLKYSFNIPFPYLTACFSFIPSILYLTWPLANSTPSVENPFCNLLANTLDISLKLPAPSATLTFDTNCFINWFILGNKPLGNSILDAFPPEISAKNSSTSLSLLSLFFFQSLYSFVLTASFSPRSISLLRDLFLVIRPNSFNLCRFSW